MNQCIDTRLVRDVMHPGVITCTVDTPVREVLQSLTTHNLHALVVVDEHGYIAGILSQTDLVHARMLKPDWGSWEELPASRLMTPYALTVTPYEPVQHAIRKLTENVIHRVVVVEDEPHGRRPVGVVSMTDLVREMAELTFA